MVCCSTVGDPEDEVLRNRECEKKSPQAAYLVFWGYRYGLLLSRGNLPKLGVQLQGPNYVVHGNQRRHGGSWS